METSIVISELKTYLGITKDSDLANYLGIMQNTLANWKSRNTLDVELIISKCEFINPTWLLTGEGSIKGSSAKSGIIGTRSCPVKEKENPQVNTWGNLNLTKPNCPEVGIGTMKKQS